MDKSSWNWMSICYCIFQSQYLLLVHCGWAHSAYPFEHYNGRLKKLYHNSQAVPKQICKTYFRLKTVDRISNMIFRDENCTVRGKLLFNKMFGSHKINSCIEYGPHLRLLQPSSNRGEEGNMALIFILLNNFVYN